MRKSIIKRLRKIEQHTFQPRWRLVTKDYDGLYRGECGDDLSQEQFETWVKEQDKDTQVIIVEVCENLAPDSKVESVTFKVENHADKNLEDMLKEYDAVVKKLSDSYMPNVDIEEYSETEKTAILMLTESFESIILLCQCMH